MSVKFQETYAPFSAWVIEFGGWYDFAEYWADVEAQYPDGDIEYIIVG